MNLWKDFNAKRINADDFMAVIEISQGSKKKYELDKETGAICLDRVLFTSMQYPANYGFIPRTLSEDGDPLDVLVLCSEIIDPLVLVRCKPIGMVTMIDDGKEDEKIIAVPLRDPNYNIYNTLDDLPKHIFEEIMHFFSNYKALEPDRTTEVKSLDSAETAREAIKQAKELFLDTFEK